MYSMLAVKYFCLLISSSSYVLTKEIRIQIILSYKFYLNNIKNHSK